LTSAAASSSSSSIACTSIKARSCTISNYSDTNHCQCLLKSTFNAHSIAANSYSPTTDKERKKAYVHLSWRLTTTSAARPCCCCCCSSIILFFSSSSSSSLLSTWKVLRRSSKSILPTLVKALWHFTCGIGGVLMMNEWIPAKLLLKKRHQSGRGNGWSFTYFFIYFLFFGFHCNPRKCVKGSCWLRQCVFFLGVNFVI